MPSIVSSRCAFAFFLVLLVVSFSCVDAQRNITFPFMHWGTFVRGGAAITSGTEMRQGLTAALIAKDYLNSHTSSLIPNDVTINFDIKDHGYIPARAISYLMNWYEQGYRIILGNPLTDILVQTGLFGNVYGMAQISTTASAISLTDKVTYPWITRLTSPLSRQAEALFAAIEYYSTLSVGGPIGWDRIAIIGTTDSYSIEISEEMIRLCNESKKLKVITYQQVLQLEGVIRFDVSIEVNELRKSGCRIILGLGFYGWGDVVLEGVKQEIVGDNYVWMTSGVITGSAFYTNLTTFQPIPEMIEATRGAFGVIQYSPRRGAEFDLFDSLWRSADPTVYPLAGPNTIVGEYALLYFDMILVTAQVITQLDKEGLLDRLDEVDCAKWSQLYRNTSLPGGASGPLVFTEDGEREAPIGVLNFRPEKVSWSIVAYVAPNETFTTVSEPLWHDNTTTVPDLDIRPEFNYWSCKHKEERTDKTGKTIHRQKPDGDDVDYIDEGYHCDQYIDCDNMSDETVDCDTNYIILYVIFGVLAGVMIIVCLLLIVFVVVFGWVIRRKRLRAASPLFLLIMIVASIFGLSSIYAWFGKPHPVACGFQPWLLGLGVSALITALFARCLRIWRIFTFPMNQTRITNVELFFFWIVTMIPSIIILVVWFIVSTPTATMVERDGREHYVCETGGFTGPPGGLVFFFVFVGYNGFLALASAALTIATRKVPSLFNETRLLAITVYNLIFLAAIVIPTVIVLIELDYPFVAWIIRAVAILYAFTTTLALQFIPKMVGLVILDRCKDLTLKQINLVNRSSSSSSTGESKSKTPGNNTGSGNL